MLTSITVRRISKYLRGVSPLPPDPFLIVCFLLFLPGFFPFSFSFSSFFSSSSSLLPSSLQNLTHSDFPLCPPSPSMPGRGLSNLAETSPLTLAPTFGARLHKQRSTTLCLFLTHGLSDLTLVVARSVLLPTSTMITSVPRSPRTSSTHLRVFWKGFERGDVVYHHRHRGVANVRWDQASESFLPSGIPELKSVRCGLRGTWSGGWRNSSQLASLGRRKQRMNSEEDLYLGEESRSQWSLGTCCRRNHT